MNTGTFILLIGTGAGLMALGLTDRGKNGAFPFLIGAVVFLSTIAIQLLRIRRTAPPATNRAAILGAVVGLFAGGYIGATSGFGRKMIAWFNPGLPERDFGGPFGAIGGGLIGAFTTAILCGCIGTCCRRTPCENSSEADAASMDAASMDASE